MLDQEHLSQFHLFTPFSSLCHGVFSRAIGSHHSSIIRNTWDVSNLVFMKQEHGKKVIRIEENAVLAPPCCDGIMTNCKGVALVALHADCQAAIFYDPIKEAIAVVHAGWRGQVQEIYAECIRAMAQEFGSLPSDLYVAISPSLGPEYSEFIHYSRELPASWHRFRIKEFHFDLWEISKWQLLEAGILPEHIEIAGVCTYSTEGRYFSYRRDKGILGHNATVCALV